jgi:malonate-semialdehyde dehydrogenase (acetylating)/methylmalonate-semialdehyde dehydrogenase
MSRRAGADQRSPLRQWRGLFTSDGNAAREFAREIAGGHGGHQRAHPRADGLALLRRLEVQSLFGDMHTYGEDGVRFYTRQKSIMQRWPGSIAKGAEFVMPTAK